jgi:MscS family membrane protein
MKRFFFLLLTILITGCFNSFAQNLPPVTLNTPYNTVQIHLVYLQPDSYQPEKAARALDVPDPGNEESQELAKQLKKIFDGRQLLVIMENIPKDPNYVDSVTNKQKFIPFPEFPQIFLEKVDGKWKYSKETVERIPALYTATYPAGLGNITDKLPDFWKRKFLGLMLWKYIGILIYIIAAWLLYQVFRIIIRFFLRKIFVRFSQAEVFNKYVRPIAKPLSLLVVLIIAKELLAVLQLPIKFGYYIAIGMDVIMPVIVAVIAFRLSDFVGDVLGKLAGKTETTVDDNLVPLVRKAMKVIAVIIGGIYVLENMNIDITPLLAGVSIGGLAFALAAQDTVKNLFGSVTIFTDQPFEIGDWINYNGVDGTVEEVGVRSTRMRTFYNSVVSIPNGKVADSMIDNMGRRKYRRFSTSLSLTYDTPPDLIDAYVEGLRKIVVEDPEPGRITTRFTLTISVRTLLMSWFYIFFDVPDWGKELGSAPQGYIRGVAACRSARGKVCLPDATIHVEDFPGQSAKTPDYSESRRGIPC